MYSNFWTFKISIGASVWPQGFASAVVECPEGGEVKIHNPGPEDGYVSGQNNKQNTFTGFLISINREWKDNTRSSPKQIFNLCY